MSLLQTTQDKAPMTDSERMAWVQLYRTKNVGVMTFSKLIARYGSASEALKALPELSKRGGAAKPLEPPKMQWIEKEVKALAKMKGRIVTMGDEEYPDRLAACDDAPPVISVIGDLGLLARECVAMVGARNASLNGRKFATHLARELGARDHVVVSGLAEPLLSLRAALM